MLLLCLVGHICCVISQSCCCDHAEPQLVECFVVHFFPIENHPAEHRQNLSRVAELFPVTRSCRHHLPGISYRLCG